MALLDEIAAALPDYHIGEELGRGGFGVVFAGQHEKLERDVAIKLLISGPTTDPKVVLRFAAEARALARLKHPHIVDVYDFVERDGLCLLVMELLAGGSLWQDPGQRRFDLETTCSVVMALCAGLHYAHKQGILHRDVKPENVLFSTTNQLKITDFGIAKVIGGKESLTNAGEFLGTPAYMAPEQAEPPEKAELGPAADIYSAGVILYELLSGRLPFSLDGGAAAILHRHAYEEPVPLSSVAPDVVPQLADVTMRAFARSPEDRFPTAEEFGIAIGGAVTPAWGPGWLDRAHYQILEDGPIRDSAGPARPDPGPAPPGHSGPPLGGFSRPAPPGPSPVRPAVAAAVLYALAIILALVGTAGTDGDRLPAASPTLGESALGTNAIPIDFSRPVTVRFRRLPNQAQAATRAQLGLSVAGVPLPPSPPASLVDLGGGLVGATIAVPSVNRYLAADEMNIELRLQSGTKTLWRRQFPASPAGLYPVTAPRVLGVAVLVTALVLFAGRVMHLLTPVEQPRWCRASLILATVVRVLAGMALAWLLIAGQPSVGSVTICLGASAGANGLVATAHLSHRWRPAGV